MGDFRKLQVWERSHRLTLEVYRITASFPRSEQYALTSQIRRSAASVPANIAEGCGRNGDAELARFLDIAMGSANEVDYHLQLACDLGLLDPTEHRRLPQEVQEINNMLAALTLRLRRPKRRPEADSR